LNLGAAVEEVLAAELQASNGRFKGIRFSTSWDAAPEIVGSPNDDRAHVLREAPIREGLKTLGKLGLTFDAWLFFTQHADFIDVVDATPDTLFVLHHCGGPLGYGPYAHNKPEHYAAWKAGIVEIAKRPNVVCKVGGVLGRGAAFDYLNAERPPTSEELTRLWRPWFEPTIEAFGADRCMFESNVLLERMGTSYLVLWNCFKRIAAHASGSEKQALFAGTADRVYRIGRGYAAA
jgi:L-fuconolactonase